MTAGEWANRLGLLPHPEGGYYKETYRSELLIDTPWGPRPSSTQIYYLLEKGDFSAFHRIRSDEVWHLYDGGGLVIHCLDGEGYRQFRLGLVEGELHGFQAIVPAGTWFAAEPAPGADFALCGASVAPGFEFDDLVMAERDELLRSFPGHEALIHRLTR